jgi:hypothetical protein
MHSTWGDPHFMGLTAIELITCESITKSSSNNNNFGGCALNGWIPTKLSLNYLDVDASPRDLNVCGHTGDPRTLDKLVNGTNATIDDRHMWLIPYTKNGEHVITIDMGDNDVKYAGIKVWNYNKSVDDSHRGVRHISIDLDGKTIYGRSGWDGKSNSIASSSSIIELRKAHGNVDYDYGQIIWFGREPSSNKVNRKPASSLHYRRPLINQDYETPILPTGHVFKFSLNATWGDP